MNTPLPAAEPEAAAGATDGPVFIVGVSRSGTTLMRKTLESSPELAIAHENHFLGHLLSFEGMRQRMRRYGDRSDDANVRRLVDGLYGEDLLRPSRLREQSRHWRWMAARVPREQLLERILASDRSDRALFEILIRTYAEWKGKPRFGEKTPTHLRHVDTLLDWFPNARVIHMVRDPRAVFVSELRRRRRAGTVPYRYLRHLGPVFSAYILLQTTLVWLEAGRRDLAYRRRHPERYRAVRFEDLVTRPEVVVPEVCRFIDIPFGPPMLEQVVVSRGFSLGEEGFDARAADRWRGQIHPLAARWLATWLGRHMRRFGYGR